MTRFEMTETSIQPNIKKFIFTSKSQGGEDILEIVIPEVIHFSINVIKKKIPITHPI